MWVVNDKTISMAEGDYGIQLPGTIKGTTFTANDVIKFTFKTAKNGTTVLTKEYTPVNGAVNLELTEAESALFKPGSYVYSVDWYQAGNFMCNIIDVSSFKVVDKA